MSCDDYDDYEDGDIYSSGEVGYGSDSDDEPEPSKTDKIALAFSKLRVGGKADTGIDDIDDNEASGEEPVAEPEPAPENDDESDDEEEIVVPEKEEIPDGNGNIILTGKDRKTPDIMSSFEVAAYISIRIKQMEKNGGITTASIPPEEIGTADYRRRAILELLQRRPALTIARNTGVSEDGKKVFEIWCPSEMDLHDNINN